MEQETELWSVAEKMAYTKENATLVKVQNVYVLATPKGEPLLTRIR